MPGISAVDGVVLAVNQQSKIRVVSATLVELVLRSGKVVLAFGVAGPECNRI